MGSDFDNIRAKAKAKRDQLIELARRDYEATLKQIAKLEAEIAHRTSRRKRCGKISEAIDQVMPMDKTFTILDIVDALEKMDPTRVWRERSVMSYITRLREKGLVKRVKRATNQSWAVYARMGVVVDESAFADMTLTQVMEACLTRTMTITELTLAMLEAGYETTMTRTALREAVSAALRRNGKFRNIERGKWATVATMPFPK